MPESSAGASARPAGTEVGHVGRGRRRDGRGRRRRGGGVGGGAGDGADLGGQQVGAGGLACGGERLQVEGGDGDRPVAVAHLLVQGDVEEVLLERRELRCEGADDVLVDGREQLVGTGAQRCERAVQPGGELLLQGGVDDVDDVVEVGDELGVRRRVDGKREQVDPLARAAARRGRRRPGWRRRPRGASPPRRCSGWRRGRGRRRGRRPRRAPPARRRRSRRAPRPARDRGPAPATSESGPSDSPSTTVILLRSKLAALSWSWLPGLRQSPSPTSTTVAPSPARPAHATTEPLPPLTVVAAFWASVPAEMRDWPPRTRICGSRAPLRVSPVPSLLTV